MYVKKITNKLTDRIYDVYSDGRVFSYQKNKFLPLHDSGKGYKFVNLYNSKSKRSVPIYIHRLVAEHFIENKKNKSDVNHIDGNKSNNDYSNLEWATRLENMTHARDSGLFDKFDESVKKRQRLWIGETLGTRTIISLTGERNRVGNYKVLTRCICDNEIYMWQNDFKKNKHRRCMKCRTKK